jgi:hypothetical protein
MRVTAKPKHNFLKITDAGPGRKEKGMRTKLLTPFHGSNSSIILLSPTVSRGDPSVTFYSPSTTRAALN